MSDFVFVSPFVVAEQVECPTHSNCGSAVVGSTNRLSELQRCEIASAAAQRLERRIQNLQIRTKQIEANSREIERKLIESERSAVLERLALKAKIDELSRSNADMKSLMSVQSVQKQLDEKRMWELERKLKAQLECNSELVGRVGALERATPAPRPPARLPPLPEVPPKLSRATRKQF